MQLQIQQLEKELSREKELRAKGTREAWADESVPDGVRPASAPEREAATQAPEVGNAPQEPACVQTIRSRAADAIRRRAEEANKKKTGAAKREDAPTWKAQSWLLDGSSAKLAELLLGDGTDQLGIRTRTQVQQLTLFVCPGRITLRTKGGGAVFPRTEEGVFSRFSFALREPGLPKQLEAKLFKPAGPPRTIPTSPSGKPQEPTAKDWLAAAEYHVHLQLLNAGAHSATELRLAFDYAADCARVYLGDTLLTDNWFSGYYGSDGTLEVGLTYLSGELPSLIANGTVLRLLLLPIQKATLQKRIWLQPAHWPDFRHKDVVCRLDAVRVLGLQYSTLVAKAEA